MGKPNRTVAIHTGILTTQLQLTKKAMTLISEKDSLNKEDAQAIKVLAESYQVTLDSLQGKHQDYQGVDTCNYDFSTLI